MSGGRGLRSPRPKLGSSASGEEELLATPDEPADHLQDGIKIHEMFRVPPS